MNTEILEQIGLSRNEIKVYFALLELDQSSATPIVKKADIPNSKVYPTIEKLIKKGLVSYAKVEHRRIYNAANPEKLLEFLDVKKREVQSILPQLKAIYKSPPAHEEAFFVFKGKNGVKSIFEGIARSKSDYDKLGSEGKFKEIFPYYYNQYQSRKKESKIKCRIICSSNEKGSEAVKEAFGRIRFLPSHFLNPSTIIVYSNKVAIIVWKDEPIGILMNSEEVANSWKYYFELLWKIAESKS